MSGRIGLYLFTVLLLMLMAGALLVLLLPLFIWAGIQESPFFAVLALAAIWFTIGRVIFRRIRAQDNPG
jgi:hypothetical protein